MATSRVERKATTTSIGAVPTSRTLEIIGTSNQVNVSPTGAQDLSANRSWTLSLPQSVHTGATPTFAGLTLTGFSGAVSASAGVLSAGTLSIANGGTNGTSFTTNAIVYYNGTRLTNGSDLTYDGTYVGLGTTGATPLKLGVVYSPPSGNAAYTAGSFRMFIGNTNTSAFQAILGRIDVFGGDLTNMAGLFFTVRDSNGYTGSVTEWYGANGDVFKRGQGTVSRLVGIRGLISIDSTATGNVANSASLWAEYNTTSGAAGTYASASLVRAILGHSGSNTFTTLRIFEPVLTANSGAGTISRLDGYYMPNPSSTGTITNLYGLYIESLTRGSTANHAIFLAGTAYTQAEGITWGGGAYIHQSAANKLVVNNTLNATTALQSPLHTISATGAMTVRGYDDSGGDAVGGNLTVRAGDGTTGKGSTAPGNLIFRNATGSTDGLMTFYKSDATTKIFEMNDTGMGFYATAPVAKPTGVAVTAAGIHAALVTLGLIAA